MTFWAWHAQTHDCLFVFLATGVSRPKCHVSHLRVPPKMSLRDTQVAVWHFGRDTSG
jgi:hypothetical protein